MPTIGHAVTHTSVRKKRSHTESRRHGEEEKTENEIGGIVAGCAIKVHMRLDPGLLESVSKVKSAFYPRQSAAIFLFVNAYRYSAWAQKRCPPYRAAFSTLNSVF